MSTPQTFDAVGLDAGSERTRCVICRLEANRIRFLGCGSVASQGWQKGWIHDQAKVSESILAAVREAERNAGVPVESAVLGIGAAVRGANSSGLIDLGSSRLVEQRDVNRAVDRARHVPLPAGLMALHVFPQDFVVDGHPGHRDPRTIIAVQIVANVHLVMTSQKEHECLVTAVNHAHLVVEETVSEALAAAYAAVLPSERRDGVALLNVGAHSSELAVFYGDAMQLAMSLPVGGDHLTRDVASGLGISFEDAVQLKHEFGCAQFDDTPENSFVVLPSRDDRDAPRRKLNFILHARAEELFQMVRDELARIGMDGALMGGLFLSGGGSLLEGMSDLAEQVLRCGVYKGVPVGIADWPDEICDPTWTTVAGLAMYSAKLKSQREMQKRSYGLLAKILK